MMRFKELLKTSINIEVSKVGDSRLSLSVQFDDNRFHLIKLVFAESERDKKSGI